MKLLVIGAGAVGGLVAARLARAGHDVAVVARGAQLAAIRAGGVTVHAPGGADRVALRAFATPDEAARAGALDPATVVLLAVKTQDAAGALRALATAAPTTTPVACLTNGLEAERLALRWFERVHGVCVNTPAAFLEPGVVEAWGTPHAGMFDVGRYPAGRDATSDALAAAFDGAGLSSRAFDDVMRWKRGKLIFNLTNALDALCGPAARTHPLATALRAEGLRCYAAAGLSTPSDDEARARRGDFQTGTIAGRTRTGGSTWQSLARGASLVECEYLNGEIALLGRLHGVATPLNDGVLREVTRAAAEGRAPGAVSIDVLAEQLTR